MNEETQAIAPKFDIDLTRVVKPDLTAAKAEVILRAFEAFFTKAKEEEEIANTIIVQDEDDFQTINAAKGKYNQVRGLRLEVDKVRKALKEDSLREGQTIDAIARVIKNLILPIEEHLKKQKDFVKIRKAERERELTESRAKLLAPFHDLENPIPPVIESQLGTLTEESFQKLFAQSEKDFRMRKDAAAAELEKEVARKKAEAEEKARQEAENARLVAEAKAAAAEAEAERAKRREAEAKLKGSTAAVSGLPPDTVVTIDESVIDPLRTHDPDAPSVIYERRSAVGETYYSLCIYEMSIEVMRLALQGIHDAMFDHPWPEEDALKAMAMRRHILLAIKASGDAKEGETNENSE